MQAVPDAYWHHGEVISACMTLATAVGIAQLLRRYLHMSVAVLYLCTDMHAGDHLRRAQARSALPADGAMLVHSRLQTGCVGGQHY